MLSRGPRPARPKVPLQTRKERPRGLPRTSPLGVPLQWVRTSVVAKYGDPFGGCWRDIDSRIRLEEIDECLAKGEERLHEPTSWAVLLRLTPEQALQRRREHIQKIAWFVRNGFQEPLEVDVGVPFLGCHVEHKVQDGNHRLAAALYRSRRFSEDPWLPLSVAGDIAYAVRLGLWNSRQR